MDLLNTRVELKADKSQNFLQILQNVKASDRLLSLNLSIYPIEAKWHMFHNNYS